MLEISNYRQDLVCSYVQRSRQLGGNAWLQLLADGNATYITVKRL